MESLQFEFGTIGHHLPGYIIAEIGVNHNGNPDLAIELIRSAYEAGANCVKFQTFTAESVVTAQAPKAQYQLERTNPTESQYSMLKSLELPAEAYPRLIAECRKLRLDFLSTPYSYDDVIFLNELGVAGFKIASGQVVETPFLEFVAKFRKPVIVSTGMATLEEVAIAVALLRNKLGEKFSILQCTTDYPARLEDANVLAMRVMQERFSCLIGFSDHTMTSHAAMTAAALGAKVFEKHLTLDQHMTGPDHSCSLEPNEFAGYVSDIRKVETALGSPVKEPTDRERLNLRGMRRSLVAIRELRQGHCIKEGDLTFKRPGTGIVPSQLAKVVGRSLKRSVNADELLSYDDLN